MSKEQKPEWWPKNPYPEDVFPMTKDEYIDIVASSKLRSAISGCLGRWAWEVAEKMIWESMKNAERDFP